MVGKTDDFLPNVLFLNCMVFSQGVPAVHRDRVSLSAMWEPISSPSSGREEGGRSSIEETESEQEEGLLASSPPPCSGSVHVTREGIRVGATGMKKALQNPGVAADQESVGKRVAEATTSNIASTRETSKENREVETGKVGRRQRKQSQETKGPQEAVGPGRKKSNKRPRQTQKNETDKRDDAPGSPSLVDNSNITTIEATHRDQDVGTDCPAEAGKREDMSVPATTKPRPKTKRDGEVPLPGAYGKLFDLYTGR
jgi:hypothetical protein